MPETHAQRTLVKSPPELWSEISDAQTLARRLSAFGEVRITRKEPETAVAWEGTSVRGTVVLEASGWGTKVTITAERLAVAADEQETVAFDTAAVAEALAAPEPAAEAPGALAEPAEAEREPTTATASAEPEATGTDIPPQDDAPAPREGFLARLSGWWHTGSWAARPIATAAIAPAPAPEPVEVEPAERAPAPPIPVEAPEVEPTVRAETPVAPEPAPEPAPAPAATTEPERAPEADLDGLLVAVLDDLGSAHHRPFSRA